VVAQEHLPEKRTYYEPSDQGFEMKVRERMEKWKQLLKKK
jgi:replication-associated recombination protein RarA